MSHEIFKPSELTHWVAYGPDGTLHEGVTEPDLVTTSGQPEFIQAVDPEDFATEFQGAGLVDRLPPLPPAPEGTDLGEFLERDSLWNWEGRTVIVVQSHNRTQFPPDLTPALFRFARTTQEWEIGVLYQVDDEVTWEGITYRCLQAHTSIDGWQPPNVPALWTPV